MDIGRFDYSLPVELIAKKPLERRDGSRLMVIDRKDGKIVHEKFVNVLNYLSPDDLMIFNESKVFPARLYGHKDTGGKVEILLTKPREGGVWEFIGKGIGRSRRILFGENLEGKIIEAGVIKFNKTNADLMRLIDIIGKTPLPPYVDQIDDLEDPNIRQRYQTVYAREIGSIAAPTAGFHFTQEMMTLIKRKAFVTLHVGLGTFLPVKARDIENHKMHTEEYEMPRTTLDEIEKTRRMKSRVVAVGTTSVRTLESYAKTGIVSGDTQIFIYPGYKFQVVDCLITNFHLPKSTLLMLVSAFAGEELIRRAYSEAIKEKYRFFSFGDAMLIL